jgi:hypothetical protein
VRVFSRSLGREVTLEKEVCRPLLKGNEIHRYEPLVPSNIVLFPYRATAQGVRGCSEQELRDSLRRTHDYLLMNRRALDERSGTSAEWFLYKYPKNLGLFDHPKLVTSVLALRPSFTLDREGEFYFVGGGNAGGYGIILSPHGRLTQTYLLGLLNSTIADFYVRKTSTTFRGGYYSYAKRFIERLPIRIIDFDNPQDVARHDKMVALVERMLDLHKKLAAASIPADKKLYQRQTEATDEQIDALVYELYGLSEEEIAIVEGRDH